MKQHANDKGADLLVVDTGDRIEGNGLYDSSTPKGLFQYDIFREQDVDILTVGNHELYKAYSVDCEHNITVPNFPKSYIASNLDYIDPETGEQKPLAQRYRKFKTKNQGIEIVAFGFLFDFKDNAKNSVVQNVEDTLKEKWFEDAIRENPDLFVVAGHVGVRMDEFKAIFRAIRKRNWDVPIVFFGGHVHVRDAVSYDPQSFAMASGRYLETIGWMSVDGIKTKGATEKVDTASASMKFTRRYIDNNLHGLYHHSGKNASTFPTREGERTTKMIARARKALDLDHQYGCAPKNLWVNRAKYPSEDSVFSWIENNVFPDIIKNDKRNDKSRLAILNTGGVRFDIFKGPFTRDTTFNISPFVNGFSYIPDVPYPIARKVLDILNSAGKILDAETPDIRFLTIPEQMFPSPAYTTVEDDQEEEEGEDSARLELRSVEPELSSGYTTKDDIGTDGDDTVHKPLKFYSVPNCIQSEINFPQDGEPETVDVVFIDFVQPWIVPALKFAGGDYTHDDVEKYMDGSMTGKLAEWIKSNWGNDC